MDIPRTLGERPVGALVREYAFPAFVALLVSALYSTIDRVFIGFSAGVPGMAAVASASPALVAISAIGALFAAGSRSLASVALGRGDKPRAVEILSRSTGAAFASALLLAAAAIVLGGSFLGLMGATVPILADAKLYLRIVLIGAPFQAAAMTACAALLVRGRPREALAAVLSGVLANLALAPILIFALGWGLTGAAVATASSQILGLAFTLHLTQRRRNGLRLEPRLLKPALWPAAEVARVGFPALAIQLLGFAAMVVANNAIRPFGGELALAALGLVEVITQLAIYPIMGLSNGAQPLWGYCYGSGSWKRAQAVTLRVLGWSAGLAISAEVGVLLAAPHLGTLLSGGNAFTELFVKALGVRALGIFIVPASMVPAAYFQATGRPGPAMATALVRHATLILLMALLPLRFGLEGFLWAGPIADLAAGILGLAYGMRMKAEIDRESLKEAFRVRHPVERKRAIA